MPTHCCVPMCKMRGYYDNDGSKVSYYGFPADESLRKQWTQAIRREEGENFKIRQSTKVCSKHFMKSDIKKSLAGRFFLRPNVVPSLFAWNSTSTPFTLRAQPLTIKKVKEALRLAGYTPTRCPTSPRKRKATTPRKVRRIENSPRISDNNTSEGKIMGRVSYDDSASGNSKETRAYEHEHVQENSAKGPQAPSKKKKARQCCVPMCTVRGYCEDNGSKLSYFVFPPDESLRKQWAQAIRREEGENFKIKPSTKVCSRHFKESDIKKSLTGRRYLRPNVVPSLFAWSPTSPPIEPRKRKATTPRKLRRIENSPRKSDNNTIEGNIMRASYDDSASGNSKVTRAYEHELVHENTAESPGLKDSSKHL